MKKFIENAKSYGLLPLIATSLVTYSGTVISLESADLTTLGSAVQGFGSTVLDNLVKVLPYMVVIAAVFFLMNKIPKRLRIGGGRKKRR